MAKLSAMAAKKREKKKLLMEQGVATDRSAKKMDHGQNKQVSARDSDGSRAGKQSQKKQSELHSEQRRWSVCAWYQMSPPPPALLITAGRDSTLPSLPRA